MNKRNWQLNSPINHIIFDCDGTLSTIEGIDVLAEYNNVGEEVAALTQDAMTRTGVNADLYHRRLDLVRPSKEQVASLGSEYYINRAEDIQAVINVFKRLNKTLYIISAGLLPAVHEFAKLLGIKEENVFAVDIQFHEDGSYQGFDDCSPLVNKNGKRIIITEIKKIARELIFVGDGINDLEASDLATRFIGYGGQFYRKNIAEQCQLYITSATLAALLPLTLTTQELTLLNPEEQALFSKGENAIQENEVIIKT